MAKLSARDRTELVRWDSLTRRYAIMSDRSLLCNSGNGWKMSGKIKTELSLERVVADRQEKLRTQPERRPAYSRYKALLCSEFALKDRFHVHTICEMLANDPDGVWSELDNRNLPMDLETVIALCHAYEAAQKEKCSGPKE